MRLIKNFSSLAITPERKAALEIVKAGLNAIQPQEIFKKNFSLQDKKLRIAGRTLDLNKFKKIFLLGFGKGSAGFSFLLENALKEFLTGGFVIDQEKRPFKKISFEFGTHPLTSRANITFTKNVLSQLSNLTNQDLVIVVVCGGGSAMLELPDKIGLNKLNKINKALILSGAAISEINVIRKHLSKVKGGGLAKLIYPAKIVSLIFSDVPGNDPATIASGTTIFDKTTYQDALAIRKKYHLEKFLAEKDLTETPKEKKYFKNITNLLILSNKTALLAMQKKAKQLGYQVRILSDHLQGDAKILGKKLIRQTKNHSVLLAGGETTVNVNGKGHGGRNQALVLSSLTYLKSGTLIISLDSDGLDFYKFAGAIGDSTTIDKANKLKINLEEYKSNDDSTSFFEKVNDGILTGKLGSNVSDLLLVLKK